MSDELQKKIFSENLNRLLQDRDKTQSEVAKEIDVSPQTFNTWTQGIAIPRMGKIQKLADYFHVEKSAFDNSELRILFDAAKDSTPEQLKLAAEMLRQFKKTTEED